ncbi:MAG: hypothetical protein ACP5SI_13060 [Chloroflexia bacterium]
MGKRLLSLGIIALGCALALLLGQRPGPIPAAIAGNICDPGEPACGGTPQPTATQPFAPTSTRTPTPSATPGGPTPPSPSAPPATPTPPGHHYELAVCDEPPEPIPAPWVGVADYLVENRCVREGGNTYCYGVWIRNTNESLYENKSLRSLPLPAHPVSEGDHCPNQPLDDVHRARPVCTVGNDPVYVAGSWYYNGLSRPVVDPTPYAVALYRPEPGLSIRVSYHHAYVPEPAYDQATAWNFGADYVCRDHGTPGPTPPPPPVPPTPTPSPAACPTCSTWISPQGSLSLPYLLPSAAITLSWGCSASPAGYLLSVWASDGGAWWLVERRSTGPAEHQVRLELVPGLIYRARVEARFSLGGAMASCCGAETYYRRSLLLPPHPVPQLGVRLFYYSDHDPDPAHGPDNPYETTSPLIFWNYGEMLHVRPWATWEEPEEPGWRAETRLKAWRYRGSRTARGSFPARCRPQDAPSCGWQDAEQTRYMHLRWWRGLLPGEIEGETAGENRQWVYVTPPGEMSFAYEVRGETEWVHEESGYTVTFPFTETLTVTVRLRYPVNIP